jgi:hypothetical protein
MKVPFVTNFYLHYRIRTGETLAPRYEVDFLFFSAGHEWRWQPNHGVRAGESPLDSPITRPNEYHEENLSYGIFATYDCTKWQ